MLKHDDRLNFTPNTAIFKFVSVFHHEVELTSSLSNQDRYKVYWPEVYDKLTFVDVNVAIGGQLVGWCVHDE